jgi:hypothetical protein
LRKRATEADAKLERLYDAIENGVTDLSELTLKDRIIELKATPDQARSACRCFPRERRSPAPPRSCKRHSD